MYFTNIENDRKFINSRVHEHAYRRQTRKFCAHEIKWFYSILFKDKKNKSVEYLTLVVSDTLGAVPLVVAQTGIVRAVDRDLQIVAAKSVAVGVRIREQATLEKMWKRCGITLVMIGNRTLYQIQPHNMPLFYYRIMSLTLGFKINKELS